MPAIEVSGLTKTFRTYKKQPGFAGAIRGLFKRQYDQTVAVDNVSFQIEPGELVGFLEERYGIRVADEDITTDNLDSLTAIAAYLRRKLAAGDLEAERKVAMAGQLTTVMLLAMLYLMIWKPGA